MSKVVIYHNPRCSKSRQTLTLLEERGVDLEVIQYLKKPPTVKQLDGFCQGLGCEPLDLIRTKEKRFSELGLRRDDERSRREWLELMHDHPILIERPIVTHAGKVALGRPPENALALL